MFPCTDQEQKDQSMPKWLHVYVLVHVRRCVTWCKTVVEEHDYVHEQWAVEGV